MVKRKTIPYWLLLAALMPALLLLVVGDAYARYDTTVSWNTVISPAGEQTITAKSKYVLAGKGTTLTFTLSEELAAQTNAAYTIERLQSDGSYMQYASSDLTVSASDGAATVVLHEATPPPGTYRLVATWTTEATDQTEATEQTATATFFINYSDV